jgi:hypothetical protein
MNTRVKIEVSTVKDGTMKRGGANAKRIDDNRCLFLEKYSSSPDESVLVQLDYNSDDFCRYESVDGTAAGEGMVRDGRIADGIATQTQNLTLFLPLADCIGAVLYDPEHEALMLTHLGRHNLQQNGGQKSVEFMVKTYETNPDKLEVRLSPSAGAENYPLFSFEGRSLQDVALEQLIQAGVPESNIELSNIDTTKDENYFSHSEFLKGNRQTDGRFAMVAMLAS